MINIVEDGDIEKRVDKTENFLSKFSLKNIRSKKWSKPVAETLSVTSSIARGAGDLGVPFAGLVGLALKMGAKVFKVDDVEEVTNFIGENYDKIACNIMNIQEGIEELKTLCQSSFELLADSCYKEGMLSIEAAFETFMDPSQDIDEKIAEFRSHKFELEKEYRHFLNPSKVEEYLIIIERHRGKLACVDMFDYIFTVEAKFLQMFVLFYIFCNNREGVISQFNLFNRHFMDLSKKFKKLLKIEETSPEYKLSCHTYKKVTALGAACIDNRQEDVMKLITRCGANINCKTSRVNRHKGRSDITGLTLLMLAAENGHEDLCQQLVEKFGCCIDESADNGFTPVFTAAQFGHLAVVQVLVELGADIGKGAGLATPYTVAKEYGHIEVAKFIKKNLESSFSTI